MQTVTERFQVSCGPVLSPREVATMKATWPPSKRSRKRCKAENESSWLSSWLSKWVLKAATYGIYILADMHQDQYDQCVVYESAIIELDMMSRECWRISSAKNSAGRVFLYGLRSRRRCPSHCHWECLFYQAGRTRLRNHSPGPW